MLSTMLELPSLPAPIPELVGLINDKVPKTRSGLVHALSPYRVYEAKLREIFAQYPYHPAVSVNHLVPVFSDENLLSVRARNLNQESEYEKSKFLLSLPEKARRQDGTPATASSFNEFKSNFNLFSEASLIDLEWKNVVAAGSSVVAALLPVDESCKNSKRELRAYYHEQLAPASDVDLFIYGLNEQQALQKIKHIEACVRNNTLHETTTIRTKNTITIVSQYPTRHVQIVLRLYKSISEILTGFDVDCSCVAYDGENVWASPRALASFIMQVNTIDLTRRSPSYENRLSKYSHRGFEVYWPLLDRSRIDPTIFERSFSGVTGLARLLVLEKLPHPSDRDEYLVQRRQERGRPALPWNSRYRHQLPGNLKDKQPDDIAEWVEGDDTSNYHTFTIPYGQKYYAKKIEKILYTKDILLNAEWNKPKDRVSNLHRHPAFFGSFEEIIEDCCGFCPRVSSDEDVAVAQEEGKIYISGTITFISNDPGRQTIGSFYPLTDDDWTEMAYTGNTALLCQAIVDQNLQGVVDWFSSGDTGPVDANCRDHAGRTPLQLASMCSTLEIVQYLIDHGARIVSRLYNGMTALHIAAQRGEVSMVRALLEKSDLNQEDESRKEDTRKSARTGTLKRSESVTDNDLSSPESKPGNGKTTLDDESNDGSLDAITDGSYVKINDPTTVQDSLGDTDGPDVYNVDVLAWDNPMSALHLAIFEGHIQVIELLINKFHADPMVPVKILNDDKSPRAALLSTVLALELPIKPASQTIQSLLSNGATARQADMNHVSVLHYAIGHGNLEILDTIQKTNPSAIPKVINHLVLSGWAFSVKVDSPLLTAIRTRRTDLVHKVLSMGCSPQISFEAFAQAYHRQFGAHLQDTEKLRQTFRKSTEQPIALAMRLEMIDIVEHFIEIGIDVNTPPRAAYERVESQYSGDPKSLLDLLQDKITKLRNFCESPTSEKVKAPPPLQADEYYLKYEKSSYAYWRAYHDLEQAKRFYKQKLNNIISSEPGHQDQTDMDDARFTAIKKCVADMSRLEKKLIEKGAKTFENLFPDVSSEENQFNRYHNPLNGRRSEDDTYNTSISFKIVDVTQAKQDLYLKLFEAAWSGNIEVVKQLCSTSQSPLQVAVQDNADFSPFSIALIRGHQELASLLLEIASAQYQPKEKSGQYKYTMAGENDDGEDDSSQGDDSKLNVVAQLVDDKFTVDDIVAFGENSKSQISPLTMFCWNCQFWRTLQYGTDEDVAKEHFVPRWSSDNNPFGYLSQQSWPAFNDLLEQEGRRCSSSWIRYAILKNDVNLLKYLTDTGRQLTEQQRDTKSSTNSLISSDDLAYALWIGRIDIINEMIKTTGAGLPLQKLVESVSVKPDETPEHYQGLTVHGRKRKDWANAGRTGLGGVTEPAIPPLCSATYQGNLKTIKHYLSKTPLTLYKEYIEAFKSDKRIQALIRADEGVQKILESWFNGRHTSLIHAAVMSRSRRDGDISVLEFLIDRVPQTIEIRSPAGDTPLQTAFRNRRYHSAQALIKAGANQAARNKNYQNIIHTILMSCFANENCITDEDLIVRSLFNMLDPNILQSLFLQRCSDPDPGALTPLALYLQLNISRSDCEPVIRVILEFSGGKDLEIMNGAGDYPLHSVVRAGALTLAWYLIDHRPEMLYWENATGMTPVDVAVTALLQEKTENPPSLSSTEEWSILNELPQNFKSSSAEATVTDVEKAEDEKDRSNAWRMYRMLTGWTKASPRKRKLVSLYAVNDMVKRRVRLQQKKNNREQGLSPRHGRRSWRSRTRRSTYADQDPGDVEDEAGSQCEDDFVWFDRQAALEKNWERKLWHDEVKRAAGHKDTVAKVPFLWDYRYDQEMLRGSYIPPEELARRAEDKSFWSPEFPLLSSESGQQTTRSSFR